MLDSLVRVSRRVGWRTDRFATDTRRRESRSWYAGARLSYSAKQCIEGRTPSDRHGPISAASILRPATYPPRGSIAISAEAVTYLTPGLLIAAERVVALDAGESAPGLTAAWLPGVLSDRPCCRGQFGRAEFPESTQRIHPFYSMRFHVLLNSLFKVLFNFPSRYLSAIGLVPVFSLRWSLPPALGCIPKQPDSKAARSHRVSRRKGLTPALGEATIRRT